MPLGLILFASRSTGPFRLNTGLLKHDLACTFWKCLPPRSASVLPDAAPHPSSSLLTGYMSLSTTTRFLGFSPRISVWCASRHRGEVFLDQSEVFALREKRK